MAFLVGDNGNNTLIGSEGSDLALGLGGDDSIKGLGGNDLLIGGGDKDTVFGGAGGDKIAGDGGLVFYSGFDSTSGSDGSVIQSDSAAAFYNDPYNGWYTNDEAIEVRLGQGFNGSNAVELNEDPTDGIGSGTGTADEFGSGTGTGNATGGGTGSGNSSFPDATDIFRDVATTEGHDYVLTFLYAPRPGYDETVTSFEVLINGQTVLAEARDGTNDSSEQFQEYTVSFTATGSTTSLQFISTGTPTEAGRGAYIDEVYLYDLSDTSTGDDDSLRGGAGNDTIWGMVGNDTVLGDGGDDYIEGQVGDDVLYGDANSSEGDGDQGSTIANGNGLVSEIYVGTSGFQNIGEADALVGSKSPDYTFVSTALDYPQGSTDKGDYSISQFLGSDTSSLSDPAAETLDVQTMVFVFKGYIYIPAGTHDITVGSDDGYSLSIGGQTFSEYSTPRSFNTTTQSGTFEEGVYEFELTYYENYGSHGVEVSSSFTDGDILDSGNFYQNLSDTGLDLTLVDNPSGMDYYSLPTGGDGDDTIFGNEGNDTIDGDGGDDLLYGDVASDTGSGGGGDSDVPVTPDVFQLDATDVDGDGDTGDNPSDGSTVYSWYDTTDTIKDYFWASGTKPTISSGAMNGNDAMNFSNGNGEFKYWSDNAINKASSYPEKSMAFSFDTGDSVSGTQIIYEQGSKDKGYNLVIVNGTLYASAFHKDWSGSGGKVKTLNLGPVTANTSYSVVLVHDATANSLSDRFFSGYVNGTLEDTEFSVDVMKKHDSGIGVGDIYGETLNPINGGKLKDGKNADYDFEGMIGEVLQWNQALDTTEVDDVNDYLTDKWIGSVAPPVAENNDLIMGEGGNDTIFGNEGDDTLLGGGDNDSVVSGVGNDSLRGGSGDDTLLGEAGENTLWGDKGDDRLIDTIAGGDEIHMFGGEGEDTLKGAVDVDNYAAMAGGADNDVLNFTQLSGSSVAELFGDDTFGSTYKENNSDGDDKITITSLSTGTVIAHGGGGDDEIIGGAGQEKLYGGSGNDTLAGGSNDDTLMGYSGNDSLTGGAGNDVINGSVGEDYQYGGSGNDTIYWDSKDLAIRGGLGEEDVLMAWDGNDTVIMDHAMMGGGEEANGGFEKVLLRGGDDFIIGDRVFAGDTSLHLDAGEGNDVISLWGDGDDTILAGDGDDWVYGGAGKDQIYGGDDIDYIYGGADNDTLRGGLGDDGFYFGRGDGTDFVIDSDGDNAIRFFYGYNGSPVNDSVEASDLIIDYNDVAEIVTIQVADGLDAGGAIDGTIAFSYGDINCLQITDGSTFKWDDNTDRFLGL
ncbi:calcium-binding protein [Rhodovibrionaceae bacterium A322]